MQLPSWSRPSGQIHFVESISKIDSNRSERAHQSRSDPRATEKPSGVEFTRMSPNITTFKECIEIERLVNPQSKLGSTGEESIAERRSLGARTFRRISIIPRRGDRELVVPPERFAVLRSAQRKRLRIKERTRVS